jgi:hypothetical protein
MYNYGKGAEFAFSHLLNNPIERIGYNFDECMTGSISELLPTEIKEFVIENSNIKVVYSEARKFGFEDVKWDIKITDEGLLYTVPDSVRDEDALFRIPKIDLSSAQLKVKIDGELIVVSPPSSPGAISDEYYYLESPSGVAWKLTVNVANELVTQAYMNAFLIRSENSNHFAVRHTDTLNALTYLEVFDSSNLPAMPFEIEGLLPQCFYNNGTAVRPIFFDGANWRYFADNTIV